MPYLGLKRSVELKNVFQMRRAVRDYKYEVEEGKMNEECIQYLTQLQKDWERHRVKLGVEALKREVLYNLPFLFHRDTDAQYADRRAGTR